MKASRAEGGASNLEAWISLASTGIHYILKAALTMPLSVAARA